MTDPVEASTSTAPRAQVQQMQHITVTNKQLNIAPFAIHRDATNTASRWAKWKDIERQFRSFGINDPEPQKDGLIIYSGRAIADLDESLPEMPSEGGDEYTNFIRKLDHHFLPKKNKAYARFQLGNLLQDSDESLAKYYACV